MEVSITDGYPQPSQTDHLRGESNNFRLCFLIENVHINSEKTTALQLTAYDMIKNMQMHTAAGCCGYWMPMVNKINHTVFVGMLHHGHH